MSLPGQQKMMDALARAASAAKAIARSKLRTAFSWESLDSRPTPQQLDILRAAKDVLIRIVRAGNQSGKSSTAARDCSWFLNREHPYLDVTATWGAGPLLVIVAGQDRSQIEMKLWNLTLKPLLSDPTEWKENRPSGVLSSAVNRRTGDQIIFISHNNSSPDDIKHMQSYDAHYVWLDEMPKNPAAIEELTRRTDAKRGRVIATFTQKVRNDAVKRAVDGLSKTISRLFRLNKLDNPLYAERKDEELDKISHLSKDLQRAILDGDWIESSTRMYHIPDGLVCEPAGYNSAWPHVVVADPATESKLGRLVVAASDEMNQFGERKWWIVGADYVEGIYVPSRIVREVERPLTRLNIVRRVYDTAASWFYHEAKAAGFRYDHVPDKSNSKTEWIAAANEALGRWLFVAPWARGIVDDELEIAERSEINPEKIANAHKYHLIDCLHYFLVMKPADPPRSKPYDSYWAWLHSQNNARIEMEARARARQRKPSRRRAWT